MAEAGHQSVSAPRSRVSQEDEDNRNGVIVGWFDAELAWRDVFLERNAERNTHDLSHWTSGHRWPRDVDCEVVPQTGRQNFNTPIRSQNTWIPVTTTSTIVLTPTADPPGQIGGTGHYNSPCGCTSDFVTTGNATANTIDATFRWHRLR
jgi:hypothetical protein